MLTAPFSFYINKLFCIVVKILELVILSLLAGVVIGYLRPPGEARSKLIQRVTIAGLFILLASMGAQLGADQNILSNLDTIGLKAVLLASLSVLGSVVLVYAVFRWLDPEKAGRRGEAGRK